MKKNVTRGTPLAHFRYYKSFAVYVLLLIIPVLIISLLNYAIIQKQNYNVLENSIQVESKNRLGAFRGDMQDMTKAVANFRTNRNFFRKYQQEPPFKYINIISDLRTTTFWTSFYQQIYFYIPEDAMFISAKGSERADYFLTANNLAGSTINFPDFDEKEKTFIVSNNKDKNKYNSIVITPFERNYGDEEVFSYVLFLVEETNMRSIVSPDIAGQGAVATLFFHEQAIFSSDDGMNRQLCENTFDATKATWDEHITYHYTLGDYTLQWHIPKNIYAKSLVPLAIQQALVMLVLISVTTFLFLFFLHKEYQPITQILQRLPENKRMLSLRDEFAQIDFMLSDILFSRDTLADTNEDLKKEKHLYLVFGNKVRRYSHLYRATIENGIRLDRARYACLMLRDIPENMESFLVLKSKENLPHTDVYDLFMAENRYIFLLCTDLSFSDFQEKLAHIASLSEKERSLRIGSIVEEPEKIGESYRVSLYEQDEHGLSIKQNGLHGIFPEVELEVLVEGVAEENLDKVRMALKMVRENMLHYSDFARMYLLVKISSLFQNKTELEVAQALDRDQFVLADDTNRAILTLYEHYISDMETGKKEQRGPQQKIDRNIRNICKFIDENYMLPTFSFKVMADVFDTSPSNLSHFFKKSTGETLSQYVDKVKVQRAQMLLENEEHKIVDIAQEIGYTTTTSFINHFKKHMGVTPKVYQKQRQHDREQHPPA